MSVNGPFSSFRGLPVGKQMFSDVLEDLGKV